MKSCSFRHSVRLSKLPQKLPFNRHVEQFAFSYASIGWVITLTMAEDIANAPEDASLKVASSPANAPKQPPPESPKSIKTRGLVILSFWAVVILLGVPVWLWTTSIYRASLPLQDMLDWADGKVLVLYSRGESVAEHVTGLQTYIPSSNHHRSTISART